MVCSFKEQTVHENTRFWLDVCFSREVEASGLQQQAKKCVLGGVGGLLWNAENFPHSSITENGCLENMRNYNFLRQLWLFFGVELMEVNSNLFSRCVFFFVMIAAMRQRKDLISIEILSMEPGLYHHQFISLPHNPSCKIAREINVRLRNGKHIINPLRPW